MNLPFDRMRITPSTDAVKAVAVPRNAVVSPAPVSANGWFTLITAGNGYDLAYGMGVLGLIVEPDLGIVNDPDSGILSRFGTNNTFAANGSARFEKEITGQSYERRDRPI